MNLHDLHPATYNPANPDQPFPWWLPDWPRDLVAVFSVTGWLHQLIWLPHHGTTAGVWSANPTTGPFYLINCYEMNSEHEATYWTEQIRHGHKPAWTIFHDARQHLTEQHRR